MCALYFRLLIEQFLLKTLMKEKILSLIEEAKNSKAKEPIKAIDLLKQAFELTFQYGLFDDIGISRLERLPKYMMKAKLYQEATHYIYLLISNLKNSKELAIDVYIAQCFVLLCTCYEKLNNFEQAISCHIKAYFYFTKNYLWLERDFRPFEIEGLLDKFGKKEHAKLISKQVKEFAKTNFPKTKIRDKLNAYTYPEVTEEIMSSFIFTLL